ncbi:MAG TPA: fasciclin domain-containing protein, partial [Paludibacter sp.]|nr:fasciclin domain-containing protein [Paludibacter sp.]
MTKIFIHLSFMLLLVVGCNDKDEYYARPGWLEPPIYEVLQKEGRFTYYLQCVDSTLYAPALKSSGLYTVFAPNDEAFKSFLTAKGYASVSQLPDSLINQIVSYSIVYSNYTYNHLTDVLSGGWDTLTSIRKKTNYYKSIYQMEY